MDQDNSATELNHRLSGTESSPQSRGISPGKARARLGDNRQPGQSTAEPKQLKIVVNVAPAATRLGGPKAADEAPTAQIFNTSGEVAEPPSGTAGQKVRVEAEPQQIPARMMNEFVYCQRLFYYEFVEGAFVESADTLRGNAIHQRVDSGNGALPAAKKKAKDKPANAGSCDGVSVQAALSGDGNEEP